MNRWIKTVSLMMLTAIIGALVLMPTSAAAQPVRNNLLTDIPVTGTLPGGGTFEGVLSITEFAFENGQLLVSGVLEGTATVGGVVTEITQTFTDLPASLLSNLVGGQQGRCDILTLDIPGGIELDLLGLVVDLAPVELDIFAVPGPGNLLGNLLCAVAGLLDPDGGLLGGLNDLFRLLRLLDRINNLLG